MISDFHGHSRYYDKPWESRKPRPISPELRQLYAEMEANPKFHISKEYSFYPTGFPSHSAGWS